jgi:hypothetical protein
MSPHEIERCGGCAEIIASHPVMGPRHGSAIKDLGRAWLRLLGSEAMPTAVFEEVEKGRAQMGSFKVTLREDRMVAHSGGVIYTAPASRLNGPREKSGWMPEK